MKVRAETDDDLAEVERVVAAAFGRVEEVALVDRIRASDRFVPELSLVAETGHRVVGHVLLTYVELCGRDTFLVPELAPLAVLPEHQRRGVGRALVEAAVARADEGGAPLVLVLGIPEYYPRLGFRPAADFGIEPPAPELAPAFFVRPLSSYDDRLRGRVVWPPAFDGT